MPNLDTLLLGSCLNCGKDKSGLRVTESTYMLNGQPSPNSVVVCADCGAIMVRAGGMGVPFGWFCHTPNTGFVPEM
jgi:hypothetical protein